MITTTDLHPAGVRTNIAGLPEVLARAAREHYVPAGRPLGLFLHVPRKPGASRPVGRGAHAGARLAPDGSLADDDRPG